MDEGLFWTKKEKNWNIELIKHNRERMARIFFGGN